MTNKLNALLEGFSGRSPDGWFHFWQGRSFLIFSLPFLLCLENQVSFCGHVFHFIGLNAKTVKSDMAEPCLDQKASLPVWLSDPFGCWRLGSISEQDEHGSVVVYFKRGSARLDGPSKADLDRIVNRMRTFPELLLSLEGHADSRECTGDRQKLSQKRVDVCLDYLLSSGISRERMISKAFGAGNPSSKDSLPEGIKSKRRVELVLIGR